MTITNCRSTMPTVPPRHILESQARACCQALSHLLPLVLVEGRPADRCLAGYLRSHREFGGRDRRLIGHTVFAVFRWWGWLHSLAPPPWPAEIPDPQLAAILLAATVLEQEPLPAVAALWAEKAGQDMRALQRRLQGADSLESMADVLVRALGRETPAAALTSDQLVPAWSLPLLGEGERSNLINWLQRRPPIWLRVQKGTAADLVGILAASKIAASPHPTIGQAVKVEPTRVNLYGLEAYRQGQFEIQDLASQCIGLVCQPGPGTRWWDACAGAGGKALELAALMQRKGTVVATDIRAYKLDDLRKRARRAGFPNIQCKVWDGRPVRGKQATFDGVLVDAPCTCSGTWRRNPDARWSTQPADVTELADTQLAILDAASSGVRPGGVLVYATCSLFAPENADVVHAFLAHHDDFEPVAMVNPLDGNTVQGMLQIWPWDGDCDAMFVARLQRRATGRKAASVSA